MIFIISSVLLGASAYNITEIALEDGSTILEGRTTGETKEISLGNWKDISTEEFEIRIGQSHCDLDEAGPRASNMAWLASPILQNSIRSSPTPIKHTSRFLTLGADVQNYQPPALIREIYPREATPGETVYVEGDWIPTEVLEKRVAEVLMSQDGSLGGNIHGDLNVNVLLQDEMTESVWSLLQTDIFGNPYNFRALARIDSISHDKTSTEGGLDIQILGQGFPSDSSSIYVDIDGSKCEVYSVEYYRIQCTTGKGETSNDSYYFGGSGFVREIWRGFSEPIQELVNQVTPTEVDTVPIPYVPDDGSKNRMTGLFRSFFEGYYTFYLSNAMVYLNGVETYSGYTVFLEGQSLYYLEIWAENGPFQLSFETSATEYGTGNDMPLVQALLAPTREFKISYGSETSSDISPLSTVSEVEEQLNFEIQGFGGQLSLFFYNNYLEFILPGSLFLSNEEYIKGSIAGEEFSDLTVVRTPGTGKYWSYVPSDFLWTLQFTPQLRLWINDVLAVCKYNCDMAYVQPPEITALELEDDILTMKGENLPTDDLKISVTVGGEDCPLLSVSESSYTCSLGFAEAGEHQPEVKNSEIGLYEISSDEFIQFNLQLDDLQPPVGDPEGGTFLTIRGWGFPSTLERANLVASVSVGTSPCEIVSSETTAITCVTSPQQTDSLITVTVNDQSASISGFEYDENNKMAVLSVNPAFASTLEITPVTITGVNFGVRSDALRITIGPYPCYVNSSTNTEIQCSINGGLRGMYGLVISRERFGVAWGGDYSLEFKIDSISTDSGSVYGGTRLTVKGKGFSQRERAHTVLIGRIGECTVVEVPDTSTILCDTMPLPGSFEVDTEYEVEVLGKLQELSECEGYCWFKWSTFSSPSVSSISPSEGVAGDTITFTGQYLGNEPEDILLTFDGVVAQVQSASHDQITAVVPSIPNNQPIISLLVYSKGYANIQATFFNRQNILSVSPNQISTEGAIVRVEGSGLNGEEIVLQRDLPCRVLEAGNDFVVCELGPGDCTEGCAVEFLESLTSEITGISDELRIQGNFLAQPEFVMLGDFNCNIRESSLEELLCNPQTPPGSYPVKVHITNQGFASGSFTFVQILSLTPGGSVFSSYGGGRLVSFRGSGLHPSNRVTVCGNEAEIASEDGSRILTPPLLTYYSQLQFNIEFNFPEITQALEQIGSDTSQLSFAFDDNVRSYYMTQGEKWIGVDAGAGKLIQLSALSVIAGGDNLRQYRELSGTEVQGSNNLVDWDFLFIYDQVSDTENFYRPDIKPIYRAFRLFKPGQADNWAINEVEVFGAVLLETIEETFRCNIDITSENGETASLSNVITYSPSSTPVLQSISPTMGSASGGDTIVLEGVNFGTNVNVTIYDLPCTILSASAEEIRCRTSPLLFYTEETLEILVDGKGNAATAGQTFKYAERWSNPATWGGVGVPREGESVYVYPGSTLILDTPIPYLEMIVVEGRLIVEDVPNLKISTQILTYRYGFVEIGTEKEPFTNQFEIELVGTRQDILYQTFGGKTILGLSGELDIHGVPRNPTWTLLATSANKDSDSITLVDDVDWMPGETIVIAPTGYDYTEGEKRTITEKDGRTLYLDAPLVYDHYSAIEEYGDAQIDMRAEVALLTRNIKIYGDESSSIDGYGGSILIGPAVPPVKARVSYVEFTRMGNEGTRLRYPLHLHLNGDVTDTFLRGNSFAECYNRAIVVHGTSYSTVEDNVTYDIKGHAYLIEDANEYKNVFRRNLAIYTRPAYEMLVSDQTPAAFWFSNPDNFIYDNRAAGSYYYGFWFNQPPNPPQFLFGLARNLLCTQYTEIGSFKNNIAHTNGVSGLRIEPRSIPIYTPCQPAVNRDKPDWWSDNPAVPGYIENFTSFKNKMHGIEAYEIGDLRFEFVFLADNLRSGIQIGWANFSEPFRSTRIDKALVVGRSQTNALDMDGFVGIITPQTDGLLVQNIKFYNIDDNMSPLGDSLFGEIDRYADYGGRLHKLALLSFDNSNRKIKWNDPLRGIYEDKDGSLTGTPGAFVTAYWPHLETEECEFVEDLDSLVCIGQKVRRVHLHSPEPLRRLIHKNLTVSYNGKSSTIPMITTDEKKDIKYSWAVPFVTGHEYEVFWEDDWDGLKIEIDTFEGEEYVILNFKVNSERISYTAWRGLENNDDTALLETSSLKDSDPAGTYSWGPDSFSMIFSGIPGNPSQFNDIRIEADSCCSPLSPVSSASGRMRWSQSSSWRNGRIPKEGDSVRISADYTMVLDVDTPILSYLEVSGVLEMDMDRSVTLNSELIFIRGGTIVSGTSNNPLRSNVYHTIELHGSADFHLPGIDIGDKVIVNSGELSLYGSFRGPPEVLVQNALPGEDFIFVEGASSWQVGDFVGIGPSAFNSSEVEYARIIGIDGTSIFDFDWSDKQDRRRLGRHRSFDGNFRIETTRPSPDFAVRIYLDRELKYYHSGTDLVVGEESVDMRTEVVNLSRNIEVIGSILTTDQGSPGITLMQNVKIYEAQQTAMRFESNPEGYSSVMGCLIHNANNGGVYIKDSPSVEFKYNSLFNIKWRGIEVESTEDSSISYNTIINVFNRGLTDSVTDKDAAIIGCLEPSLCPETVIRDNRAAGYSFVGFMGPGGDCENSEIFKRNLAHTGPIGWILTNGKSADCFESTSFTGSFNDLGIGSILTVPTINLSNIRLAENKIGMALRTGVTQTIFFQTETSTYITQSISDSIIVGKTHHSPEIEGGDCRVGYYTGFGDELASTEIKIPLYAARDYSHAMGNVTLDEVAFSNFRYSCQFAIQSNPEVPDFILPHYLEDIALYSVPQTSLVYMSESKFFCSDKLCSGLNNVLIEDTDGSVLGEKGAILPNNPGIASKDICSFKVENNAYFCYYEDTGYYEIFVMDEPQDAPTQQLPYTVSSIDLSFRSYAGEGFFNDIVATYDIDENFATKPRMPSIVFTGLHYNVTLSGGQTNGRVYLQGTRGRNEAVSLTFDMFYPMEMGFDDLNNNVIPAVGYEFGEDRNPRLDDPHGTNKWYFKPHLLEVILRNDVVLGIATGATIQVALGVEYFLAGISQNPNDLYYIDVSRAFSGILPFSFKNVFPAVDAFRPPGVIPRLPPVFDF